MELMEAVRSMIKELVVPELETIKEESHDIKVRLDLTNKRLDDINLHLADQSRRIDAVREGLGQRIDSVREGLGQRIDATNLRIDGVNDRMDKQREDFAKHLSLNNQRMDRLYEMVVRREEHFKVEQRVADLEREVKQLKEKVAA